MFKMKEIFMKILLIGLVTLFWFGQVFALDLPRPLPDSYYNDHHHPPAVPPREEEFEYSLGKGETRRFSERTLTFVFPEKLDKVKEIRVVGLKNRLVVQTAIVTWEDETTESLESLQGSLSEGDARVWRGTSRRAQKIEFVVFAPYFWEWPGEFRVDVIVDRMPSE